MIFNLFCNFIYNYLMLNNKFFCYYPKTHYEINNLLKINLVCLLL